MTVAPKNSVKKLDAKTMASLSKRAIAARGRAYCPYSNHPVGVAIVSGSGKVYAGANVEVAHYKGLCAEASAISAMITAGETVIRAVVVAGPSMEYLCTPCGDCRQRLREFSAPDVQIYSLWKDGRLGAVTTMADLLPLSFGPENLQEVGALPARHPAAGSKKAGGKEKKERVKKITPTKKNNKKDVSPRNNRRNGRLS
ncbi:MAG: cytidine deaminase [Bdellovibrionales bacterium]|jgi:cytidine deaminase|nr:cytidine deaminase [Bdellovibrionales bacterium]